MNERIFKLALEAMDFQGAIDTDTELKLSNDGLEKFAELIVRECSNIAEQYDAPKMSGPGMIIAGRIESHFGVEE